MVSELLERPQQLRLRTLQSVAVLLSAAALFLTFQDGLERMVATWIDSEEYSYGFIIPFISAYLIWQRRGELQEHWLQGASSGIVVVLFGVLLNFVGKLATLFALQQYAFIVVLSGLAVTLGGWAMLRKLIVPLAMLLFMVPLPNFFTNGLSAQLQLASSQLGVFFIRLAGVSVYLEGNVIDLGIYKLQVAEACSGLRYLFPLMTLGFIMAYFYKVAWWKRVLVFLSTMPVTLLLNSLRIGIIGVTVDRWGIEAAEGLLHDFEGWAVFMASTLVLLLLMMVLARPQSLRDVFDVHHESPSLGRTHHSRTVPTSFVTAVALLTVCAAALLAAPERVDVVPTREDFAEFPMNFQGWRGERRALERIYVETLQFDDYVMADYQKGSTAINLYAAWYNAQRSGQSAHSPKSCLPGGGWRITDLREHVLNDVDNRGAPLHVNRVVIENGGQRQLVYYWFQQRERNLTSEYLVKWYLFWDALWRQRTDGALIRLIVPVSKDETVETAERRLQQFAAGLVPSLAQYIPS